jgi:hypothetical protein
MCYSRRISSVATFKNTIPEEKLTLTNIKTARN